MLLAREPGVTIVGETDRIGELESLLERTPCDLLLLDLQMERNALGAIEGLAARVPVIVVTGSELSGNSLAAMRSGARAVVFKRFGVETLMDAIQTVIRGGVWMPVSVQSRLAARLRNRAANTLSPREEEVAQYVAQGLRNAEVAKRLFISEQTVKSHLNNIFQKLGVRDRVELTLYAARMGIVGTHEPRD